MLILDPEKSRSLYLNNNIFCNYSQIFFGLFLIYILKVYRKKSSLILLSKIYVKFITCIFLFEKHVTSQVLKDFSIENLETTPRSIYLELLIIVIAF